MSLWLLSSVILEELILRSGSEGRCLCVWSTKGPENRPPGLGGCLGMCLGALPAAWSLALLRRGVGRRRRRAADFPRGGTGLSRAQAILVDAWSRDEILPGQLSLVAREPWVCLPRA